MSKGRIANIDEVKDSINIVDVIGRVVTLKKAGNHYVGLCPFHDEKSPSFNVIPAAGFYKCFGCGKGGDAIKFVMEHERKEFIEAIEYLAEMFNVTLHRDEKNAPSQQSIDELDEMKLVIDTCHQKYFSQFLKLSENDLPVTYLRDRKISEESRLEWQIGYAPDEWQFLTEGLIAAGRWNVAQTLGLVTRKNEKNYDLFRNRIMFPILDHKGNVIGFGGRDLSGKENVGKYINSADSRLYNKSMVLYGLYHAQKHIREKKCAILVEGYLDVISMHQAGCGNTIATCGTALTEDQCKLLRKYTDHVILMRDGDKAGKNASLRDIDMLLKSNFKVQVFVLPADQDPDSWSHSIPEEETRPAFEIIAAGVQDAVLWKAAHNLENVGEDPDDQANAIEAVAKMLSNIENEFKLEAFVKNICKKYKLKKASLDREIRDIVHEAEGVQVVEEGGYALPPWVDKNHYSNYGFDERIDGNHTGYYFGTSNTLVKLTNFVLRPLFHIYSKLDNKRMIEITNGTSTKILEMPSKSLISLDQFRSSVFDEGFFVCEGGFTQAHLLKIIGKLGRQFPMCYELKTLGWQPEGFWAYSNYAFNGELRKFDDLGIVDIHEQKFLSLSASKVQADVRSEEDIYENDRYLKYSEAPITFSEWCELMVKVYDQNAWMGIAFAIMTVYRDIIFQTTKVPHLYAYGAVQAGKSEFGESISNLFFNQMPAFNLNQGTDFAFFSRMERFRNCPNALNEFDENGIKEEWFRAIKAAYDGEGREKGRGGKEGKTRTQKITCTLVMMGQYLSTKDDNSVLSRCIPLAFKDNNNRSEEQIRNFTKLKGLERQGISGTLIELFQLREEVKKNYADTFSKMQRRILDEFQLEGKTVKSRILKNICAPMSVIELLSDKITLPFTKEAFYTYGKNMIEKVSELISESNALAEFWRTIEFLLDRSEITEGIEFKIETLKSVNVSVDRESTQEKHFDEPKKVLFLRLNTVHNLYADILKRKNNKPAPNLDTIRLYMKDQPYWIGTSPGSFFKTKEGKRSNTSSIVLDYDKLKINLERFSEDLIDERKEVTIEGILMKDAERVGNVMKATLINYVVSGFPSKTETTYYTLYFHKMDEVSGLVEKAAITVTGLMTEKEKRNKEGEIKVYRSIDVSSFVLSEGVPEGIANKESHDELQF